MAHAGEVVDQLHRVREAAEERRLVTSAADGSSVAFEQLYRRHAARIHALCLRMTGNVATAEDCTQDAFVQAWRNLPRFETRSAFGTWLHRIAVNVVLQQARRRGESLGAGDSVEREVADVLTDHSTVDPGRSRDLETAIAGLPPVPGTCWCWWACTATRTRKPRSCSALPSAPARHSYTGHARC